MSELQARLLLLANMFIMFLVTPGTKHESGLLGLGGTSQGKEKRHKPVKQKPRFRIKKKHESGKAQARPRKREGTSQAKAAESGTLLP